MKTASHTFSTNHGRIEVTLSITELTPNELAEIVSPEFKPGGWKIQGSIGGQDRGAHLYPKRGVRNAYFGWGTELAARQFLETAHLDGFFDSECQVLESN